jgi:hypothetical protein
MLHQKSPSVQTETRASNSGLDSQVSLSIDYISCTKNFSDSYTEGDLLGLISDLGREFHSGYTIERDGKWGTCGMYENQATFANGIRVHWGSQKGFVEHGSARIEIKGDPLSPVDLYNEILLVKGLLDREWKMTRLDLALDDYGKKLRSMFIDEADKAGWINYEPSTSTTTNGRKPGFTAYIGSRDSDKRVRYYDKSVESKGEIDAYRWELQARGDYARELGEILKAMGTKFLRKNIKPGLNADFIMDELVDYAIGAFTFTIPKEGDKNKSRGEAPQEWKDWLAYLQATPVRLIIKRVKTTIQKKKDWIHGSVSKSLAMVIDKMNIQERKRYIDDLLSEGKRRFTNFDEMMIDDHEKDFKIPEMTTQWLF